MFVRVVELLHSLVRQHGEDMAAPGGPDEETWRRMSPRAKRLYWVAVLAIFGFIAFLWFKGLNVA
jgi:hypothetical protein